MTAVGCHVMRAAATTAALAALSLAALTGCGAATTSAGSFKGDARAVAQTIDDLSSAASSRDTSKICDTLLARIRKRFANVGAASG